MVKKRIPSAQFLTDFLKAKTPTEATAKIIQYALGVLKVPAPNLQLIKTNPGEVKKERTRLKNLFSSLEGALKKTERELCGQIFIQFINTKKPEKALRELCKRAVANLDVPLSNIQPIMADPDKHMGHGERSELRRDQKEFRELLSHLYEITDIRQSEKIETYIWEYNFTIRPYVGIQSDGSIATNSTFNEGKPVKYREILTYCLITFLGLENYKDLIKICDRKGCGSFHISERSTKRFCSSSCKNQHHRQEKTGKTSPQTDTNP